MCDIKARLDLRYRWKLTFYQRDLERLLQTLFDWRSAEDDDDNKDGTNARLPPRDVLFLSGHTWRGFDSVLTDVTTQQSMRQIVVGPLCWGPQGRADASAVVVSQGALGGGVTYTHHCADAAHKLNERDQFVHLQLAIQAQQKGDVTAAAAALATRSLAITCSYVTASEIGSQGDPGKESLRRRTSTSSTTPKGNKAEKKIEKEAVVDVTAAVDAVVQVQLCDARRWRLLSEPPEWVRRVFEDNPPQQAAQEEQEQQNQEQAQLTALRGAMEAKREDVERSFAAVPTIADGYLSLANRRDAVKCLLKGLEVFYQVRAQIMAFMHCHLMTFFAFN